MYRHLGKNLLNINTSSTCRDNMVNFGPLAAESCWQIWGTPANFNGFRVLAALLHGTLVVGVNQTLRRWTEGATHIRQGGHHVGHWPTFWFFSVLVQCSRLRRLSVSFLAHDNLFVHHISTSISWDVKPYSLHFTSISWIVPWGTLKLVLLKPF